MHRAKSLRHSLILLILALLMSTGLPAQSRLAYVGMSALLPGSGELALGKTNRGLALLASEIVAGYSFFKTNQDMNLQRDAYKNYALHYGGVPRQMPQEHYQVIQEYISSEEFNDFQDMMARNYFIIYHNDEQAYLAYMEANTYTGDESWEWQSPMHWKTYKDMRRKHQKTKINHNLALGVMLLNRAISMIDTAIMSKNTHLYAVPSGLDGMMLNCELRF